MQGIGGALASPSALALLMTMFPDARERTRAIGLYTAVSIGGSAVGLIAGGMLSEWASWRWVLFVNVPIGARAARPGPPQLPETPRQRGRFDLAGALTSTLGMGALVYGFVHAATDGWGDAETIGSFAVGARPARGVRRSPSCAPRRRSRRCGCSPTATGAAPTSPACCSSPG